MALPAEFDSDPSAAHAQAVVPCRDFDATLAYFTTTLGFRLHRISPADNPTEADLSFGDLGILLQRSDVDHDGSIRVVVDDPNSLQDSETRFVAPNGTRIDILRRAPRPVIPAIDQSLVISRIAADGAFQPGRAGMGYRDLIPGRQGGRFIGSHIRIEAGGEVPDYPHFHKVRFQIIFCYKGWVRVAYEDQGEPLLLQPGDCFLQPPEIAHQVLESSPGLEVIEIGCPAEHDTHHNDDLTLPNDAIDRERDFGGQRFVHHVASAAPWVPWRLPGYKCRQTSIASATDGLADVAVVRPTESIEPSTHVHDAEFLFFFVLAGRAAFTVDGRVEQLEAGDSIVIPAGMPHRLAAEPATTELLEVSLPALA